MWWIRKALLTNDYQGKSEHNKVSVWALQISVPRRIGSIKAHRWGHSWQVPTAGNISEAGLQWGSTRLTGVAPDCGGPPGHGTFTQVRGRSIMCLDLSFNRITLASVSRTGYRNAVQWWKQRDQLGAHCKKSWLLGMAVEVEEGFFNVFWWWHQEKLLREWI